MKINTHARRCLTRFLPFVLLLCLLTSQLLSSCDFLYPPDGNQTETQPTKGTDYFALADIPDWSGEPYVAVHGNVPYFEKDELTTAFYEIYAELDRLGRCGVTMACVGRDLMPTEPRESISSVKPSGWENEKYDFVDGLYVYNRCHLIGFQLTGENANEKNLITGTRYMNVQGMLPFENMVADYVKETGNHVMYRVTPVFEGDNLVASGVLMEAISVEDNGDGVLFCVFCYNVQPGVEIDYADGSNREAGSSADMTTSAEQEADTDMQVVVYILNISSGKFHLPSCSGVASMSEENRQTYNGSRDDLIEEGYTPCGICNP